MEGLVGRKNAERMFLKRGANGRKKEMEGVGGMKRASERERKREIEEREIEKERDREMEREREREREGEMERELW